MKDSIKPGAILNERYRILQQLSCRGFDSTYLAEDIQRSQASCVLREVAPQIQGAEALEKLEILLIAEAEALSKLKHQQIPNFRELFRLQLDNQRSWVFVRDRVMGERYREILNRLIKEGKKLTEAEVNQFLSQILPALEYIHSFGIIHRDISPDTLILRQGDRLPVPIDFGSIKQLAATIESECIQSGAVPINSEIVTQLWQVNYAPDEQIQRGIVFPNSDLYALAATAVVLLAGKEPPELVKSPANWLEQMNLSPNLAGILGKMLAPQPGDRFQSATEVLQALGKSPVQLAARLVNESEKSSGKALESIVAVNSTSEAVESPTPSPAMTTSSHSVSTSSLGCLSKLTLLLLLIISSGMVGWLIGKNWLKQAGQSPQTFSIPWDLPASVFDSQGEVSSTGQWLGNKELRRRYRKLGINDQMYSELVNQLFWSKYPAQEGRILSSDSQDREWQERWDEIATELSDKLTDISPEARRGMGNYNQIKRDRWKYAVNQLHLSSRALYDLANAQFFNLFPEQENQEFAEKPIGQVWNAIVFDQLKGLQSGQTYEQIELVSDGENYQYQETLQPGNGKAYVAQLNASEILEVELEAGGEVLFSLYSPTGKNNILEDSQERQWSGILPESGFYEFVIVSKTNQPLNYQMNLRRKGVGE